MTEGRKEYGNVQDGVRRHNTAVKKKNKPNRTGHIISDSLIQGEYITTAMMVFSTSSVDHLRPITLVCS